MKRALKIIIFLSVLWVGVFSLKSAQAVTCQLTNVWTGVQTIVVGQSFAVTVNGQNCANQDVTVNVYGQGGTGRFLIKSSAFRFSDTTATNVAANGNITILASEITGRTGDITASLEAVTSDSSSKVNSTSTFTIQAPVAGSCQLSSAQWHANFTANPILGSPMDMVINGSGCPNFEVNIEIKEQDVGLGDDSMGFVQATFNSQGTQATGKWTVDGSKDDDNVGHYIFYFEAAAGSGRVTSDTLAIPLHSYNGCLNCNLSPYFAGECLCADGFKGYGDRSISTWTCQDVCKMHIGDAQGGTGGAGGDGTCNNNGACDANETSSSCPSDCPVVPGASQSYFFSIPNPLKGGASDLASLVRVIAQWIFDLAIPIAVVMIVYAGVLFLMAQGSEQKVTKAKDVLKWAVVGLAIILIGSGFITLIQSILKLGGTTPPVEEPLLPIGPRLCNDGVCSNGVEGPCQNDSDCEQAPSVGAVGNRCSNDRDCLPSVLKCGSGNICQRPAGNLVGEWCNNGANCVVGLTCDKTIEVSRVIDGQTLGLCSQMSDR